jgi:hypothetical protein
MHFAVLEVAPAAVYGPIFTGITLSIGSIQSTAVFHLIDSVLGDKNEEIPTANVSAVSGRTNV